MKISLNMDGDHQVTGHEAQMKALARDVRETKSGDWNARKRLNTTFQALIKKFAQKRTTNTAEFNALMDKGREGLFVAAKKYKLKEGPDHFQIFAVDFIENYMDGKGGKGFFGKIFGK